MKYSLPGLIRGGIVIAVLLLMPPATRASDVVAWVPGNTVVQDPADDLLLRNCSTALPNDPCSLPPAAPLDLPGWFDLKTAKITQVGGRVSLQIMLYEPIPAAPPVPFVAYIWQFQDGCVVPSPTDKGGINVVWDGNTETWSARWFVILGCSPRIIIQGDSVPFEFTEDGVKVRVLLSDLLENGTSPGSPLLWFAAVRRLPFAHPLFNRTVPVDLAPDVEAFNPDPPPPILIQPEDSAAWDPR